MKIDKRLTVTGTERQTLKNLLTGFDDRFEKTVEEIRRVVKAHNKILDIGCGEGKIWQLFNGLDVVGLDQSSQNLKKAKKYLTPVLGSAERLPFPDKSFDLVVASEIFEHLLEPDKTIKEIDKVLRTGGVAIISFPNTSSIQFRTSVFLWGANPALNYPGNFHHIRFFNLSDIKKMLVDTELKIQKVRGVSFLAFHRENFGFYIPIPRIVRTFGGDMFPSLSMGNLVVLSKRTEML